MSDELNVWREAKAAWCNPPPHLAFSESAAAVIRDYGDKRYQQAIADVVEWLRVQQHGRTSDNYPGYYARQIEQRFGKGQDQNPVK